MKSKELNHFESFLDDKNDYENKYMKHFLNTRP